MMNNGDSPRNRKKSKVQLYIYLAQRRRIIICLHGDQAIFVSKLRVLTENIKMLFI